MADFSATRIPYPFATSARGGTLPADSAAPGRATWASGFPEETALPVSAGGIPPHYEDFQDVFHAITEHVCYLQDGGRYDWVASASYKPGAVVYRSGVVWQALAANSGMAPESNPIYWAKTAPADNNTIVVNNAGMLTIGAGAATTLAGPGLVKNGNALAVNCGAGLQISSDFVTPKLKSGGGIAVDANGLYVLNPVTPATLADGNTIVVNGNNKLAVKSAPYAVSAGTAGTAKLASSATKDGAGNTIATTFFKVAGGTVTGAATFSKTITVAGKTTLGGGLAVKGAVSIPTAAANAAGSEGVNAAWCKARIKEALATSGGLVRKASVAAVYGIFEGNFFSCSGGTHGWTSSGYSGAGAVRLKEGRYFISGCIAYKPVYILHENLTEGACWLRIRAGIPLTSQYIRSSDAAGSLKSVMTANPYNNCWGGGKIGGNPENQWYKFGQDGGTLDAGNVGMESFIVIPKKNGIVCIDIWDDGRNGTKHISDDDVLQFFN